MPEENDPFSKPDYLARNELIWINTPYCSTMRDAAERDLSNGGYQNIYEAKIIGKLIKSLRPSNSEDIIDLAIITPYKDQRNLISNSKKA